MLSGNPSASPFLRRNGSASEMPAVEPSMKRVSQSNTPTIDKHYSFGE